VAVELIARALNNNVVVAGGDTADAVADLKETAKTTDPLPNEPLGQDDGEPEEAPQETGGGSASVSSGEWNPYTADIVGRYGKAKIDIMRAELDAHGVEWFDSYPGKQLHAMLKEKGAPAGEQANDAQTSEPQAEQPAESPQEQPAQATGQGTDEVDKEALKKILLNGASTIGQPAVQDAMEKACGHRKLADIPADQYLSVANAVKEAVGNA